MSERDLIKNIIHDLGQDINERLDTFYNFHFNNENGKRITRFEGWLKMELLYSMHKGCGITDIELERPYPYDGRFSIPGSREKFSNALIDLAYRTPKTDRDRYVCVELKVANKIGPAIRGAIDDLYRIRAINRDWDIRAVFAIAIYNHKSLIKSSKSSDFVIDNEKTSKYIEFCDFGSYRACIIGWEGKPRDKGSVLAKDFRDWCDKLLVDYG